jgi:hypothetical protein
MVLAMPADQPQADPKLDAATICSWRGSPGSSSSLHAPNGCWRTSWR